MSGFISVIEQKKAFHSLQGATIDKVQEAEEKLGVKFSKEYIDYLLNYGVASFFGHELTGICSSPRLNVIDVTTEQRQYNQDVPYNLYVVEDTGFDDVVLWQDEGGAVYRTVSGGLEKVGGSLAEYYSEE